MTHVNITKGQNYGHVFAGQNEELIELADRLHTAFKIITDDFRHKNDPTDVPVRLTLTISLDAR